jgi:ATP-dependent protease ClpP protease subunit
MGSESIGMILGSDQKSNSFLNRPLGGALHEFYLLGEIAEASEYIDWFDTIRNAVKGDIVRIHINSFGGDLFTAIQMIRSIQETEASVICSVEGACMSAATMIFLQGSSYEVSDHSMFMFHNYSGGTIGKGGEMYDNIIHEKKWSEKLLREIYEDFLTEVEIESILNNKDIWMDSDEVIARLNLINELYSEDNEEEGDNMFDDFDDDFIEEEEEVKPKKCCGKLDDR